MPQKFQRGDHVKINDDLGLERREHRGRGREAIVCYSYAEHYGGIDTNSYCLHIKDQGESSWYHESNFQLIETGRADLLARWEADHAAFVAERSDLDWIFTHGPEVARDPTGASVEALANCFGLTNLWGASGEGVMYYENFHRTLAVATPFLRASDKAAWLKFCAENVIYGPKSR